MSEIFTQEQRAFIAQNLIDGVDQLSQAGVEQHHLFAIIDASRNPNVISTVLQAMTDECECLYRGQARENHADSSPWLVKIGSNTSTLDWIMEEVYGTRGCIFFTSSNSLDWNANHFRKFIKVKNSAGELIFFRFFDPLLFNGFVDVFSRQQREAFFDGIGTVYAEFSRFVLVANRLTDEGQLERLTIVAPDWDGRDEPPSPSQFQPVPLPQIDMSGSSVRPYLTFSQAQLEAPYLRNPVLMIDSVVNYLFDYFPDSRNLFTLSHMQIMAEAALIKARHYKIFTEAEICAFAALMWRFSPNFDDVPALKKVLVLPAPAEERLEILYTRTPQRYWNAAERGRDEEHWVRIIEEAA
ncbi:DUF4123 domain-containing protein [Rhizobiales bacterium RZME27]|uniref:DUF4123 domain-containing protein n=1 Tax=Endobacterium cereale TaxID=2663029 RepID=A0A6A8A9B1_9HYPH|nr:DUF4123 domain-containing protein [Endobacterium cereale]MQY46488.1 DUF4123 domain-containing protein [Endobacterium cereale]